jgi:hypothetical protein
VSYRIPPGLHTRRWATYRKLATLTYLESLALLSGHRSATAADLNARVALAAHRDVAAFVGTNSATIRLLERPGVFAIWDGTYGADDFGHDLAVARTRDDRGLWHVNAREHPRTFGLLLDAARRFGPAHLMPTDEGWAYASAAKL